MGVVVVLRTLNAEELASEQTDGIAADLVGVAIGKEPGLDVGAVGPFPKESFESVLVFGLFYSGL